MKNLFLLASLCLLFGVSSLNAQNLSSETRNVDNFSAIAVSDGVDVFIKQGPTHEVVVKTSKSQMDKIITEVSGDNLRIKMKKGNNWSWRNNTSIKVYVTMPDLKAISASGGSDVTAEDLNLDNLDISTSGGADVDLSLEVGELKISCSGGADVALEGKARDMKVSLSGGSDLNAQKLVANSCKISTSGGADANINVTGDLEMVASGASDINYRGNPNVISSKSSGAADIRKN